MLSLFSCSLFLISFDRYADWVCAVAPQSERSDYCGDAKNWPKARNQVIKLKKLPTTWQKHGYNYDFSDFHEIPGNSRPGIRGR